MLKALNETLGNVSSAVKKVCADSREAELLRRSHYKWIKSDPEYENECTVSDDIRTDFVESKLNQLINELNPTAIIFYLKTKGKGRGYVETNIVDHTSSDNSMSAKIITTMSKEELKEALNK